MMATRNDLCSSLYVEKTLGNHLKCDRSLVNISWTVSDILSKNRLEGAAGGGG